MDNEDIVKPKHPLSNAYLLPTGMRFGQFRREMADITEGFDNSSKGIKDCWLFYKTLSQDIDKF